MYRPKQSIYVKIPGEKYIKHPIDSVCNRTYWIPMIRNPKHNGRINCRANTKIVRWVKLKYVERWFEFTKYFGYKIF